MGDSRFTPFFRLVRESRDPGRAIRELGDEAVVAALAAASREHDPYLANVLATEAMNRMRRNGTIVELAGEGLLALDREGRLTYMNPAAEEMLGWRRLELLGRDIHEVLQCSSVEGNHAGECPIQRVLREGRTVRVSEDGFTRRDGTHIPVAFAGTPIMREEEVMGVVVAFNDIRQQKESQATLLELKARVDDQAHALKAVLEATPDLLLVLDAEGRFHHASHSAADALGLPTDVLVGRTWRELGLPAGVMEPFLDGLREVLAQGSPQQRTATVASAVGERQYEYMLAPLGNGHVPPRVLVVARDVTDRQRLHAALEESEARHRNLYENIPAMYFRVGLDGLVLSVNLYGATHLGYPAEALVGTPAVSLYHPDDTESFLRHFHDVAKGRAEHVRDIRRKVTKDGRVMWVDETLRLSEDPDGARVILVACTDVTRQRRAHLLVEGQAQVLEDIASGKPLLSVLDRLARLVESVTDMRAAVMLRDAQTGALHHAAAPSLPEAYRRAMDGLRPGPMAASCGTAIHRRQRVIVTDVSRDPLWADYRDVARASGLNACWSTPILSSKGEPLGTFALHDAHVRSPTQEELRLIDMAVHVARIAVERSRDEAARRRSAARAETILERTTDAFFSLDSDWRFAYVNRRAEAMLRRQREELVGAVVWDAFPEVVGTDIERTYREARAKDRPVHFEAFYAPLETWFEIHAFPTEDDGLSVYFRDVTERKRAEQEIQRMNAELEARVRQRTKELADANRELESFSYSVSHDLRAPLRAIDYFAELLETEHGKALDEEGLGHLRRLRAEAHRLGSHIQGLLEVSRASTGPLRREAVDLSALAEEIAARLAETDPKRKVRWEIGPGLVAQGEPRLLRSLLENLLNNAWKFTSQKDEALIELFARPAEGRTVYVVRDNGAGFDPTRVGMLFRSFHRLHASSEFEGTGVGLATVKRIVERHGGRVWAEGEPGKGATFSFTLA